jgi:hypothetical protein
MERTCRFTLGFHILIQFGFSDELREDMPDMPSDFAKFSSDAARRRRGIDVWITRAHATWQLNQSLECANELRMTRK